MIKILKASAGSGKTYALAKEYISLLTGKYAYRHILAVTFTNKATAEMKSRILKFLSESSDKNEREMLRDILHDYSAFAVSTIDKFFQQALKAFAREIGQVADYQIDLDKDSLIREAMDRILDSLTRKDTEILDWMQRSVATDLSQGKRVNIEESLYEMGGRLMMQGAGSTDELQKRFSKKNLQTIRANCEQIIGDFTDELNAAAKDVVVSKANSVKQLAPYLKGFKTWEMIPQCKATLMKEADGSVFCDLLFGKRYTWYCTAWLLRDMSFSLGLAGEFYRSYRELLKEKNVMVLDESNVILKDIIAGSDAPFVYEKMGVRYENFLIDEFQDTSNIQWENFRPLLKESDANDHKNLIVGDVKQSIYRWRDSDWTLLDHKVNEDFPLAKVELKQENRRSLKNIVNFNNAFFEFASRIAGHPGLYADVRQKIMTDDAREGLVRVSFCGKDEQISKVRESIADAVSAGARYGEITVLVRANAEGSTIANALIQDGIPVVSDDSLNLKSSKILRKLTGILANHENPDDKINSYLARTEAVEFPDEFHSLTDLCEVLLRQLRESSPEDFEGETLYIQAFMDDLREWCASNGNELREYLHHWNDAKLTISSPEGTDAVRVITIHKSKGLEAPYLIFPYAHKVDFYKAGWQWCNLDTDGTPFIPEAAGSYPVYLSGSAENTLFADALHKEQGMQKVDNLNVFYVALTRAKKCLHVIAQEPSKKFRESMDGAPEYGDFSQVLYKFCGGMDEYRLGSMYDFAAAAKEKAEKETEEKADAGAESVQMDFPYSYLSIPVGNRLRVSADASDFFGEDGAVGPAASARRNGIVLHSILSGVQVAGDLRGAVDEAIFAGRLSPEEGEDAFRLLQQRIEAHKDWFAEKGLNETSVFDANGEGRRPDRVIIRGNDVTVIDYKFGDSTPKSDARYSKQVREYMDIFRSIGYENVSGSVWYVVTDKLVTLQSV